MEAKKILDTTPMDFGCELRREIVSSPRFDVIGDSDEAQEIAELLNSAPDEMEMISAYASDGSYIGSEKTARWLIYELGISPERATPSESVASIGWCEREQKWYGWSHRAIYGFSVHSTVKRGDCGYMAPNAEAFGGQMLDFFCDHEYHSDKSFRPFVDADGVRGVLIEATYTDAVPNENLRGTQYRNFCPYPETWGRGEWVAETLDDAKQMAIDFAESVS